MLIGTKQEKVMYGECFDIVSNCFCSFVFVCILMRSTSFTQDTWLYHLSVAAGSSATLKVGTEYEQLIGKLLDAEGDPGEKIHHCHHQC